MQDLRSTWSSTATYELHKRLINQYLLCRPGATGSLKRDTSRDKRDIDVIHENHRFLWDDNLVPDTWEAKLAKKYYDKLFKEYSICDLSRYKENMTALRWRTEKEVVSGKGQFSCAEKSCSATDNLRAWEVNFGYLEKGEKKNALVKIRLCENCSEKLNFCRKHKELTKKKKRGSKEKRIVKRTADMLDTEIGNGNNEKKIKIEKPSDDSDEKTEIVDSESAMWKEAGEMPEDRTREDEFNDYLEDLLL